MNLVYGSSSSSYMDCMVFFGDECFIFCRSGVRLDQCSCIGAYVVGLFIFGRFFYGSATCRMSTRRLPVILFVSCIEYPFISCCLLRGVPVVAGGAFTLYAYIGMSVISHSFIAFCSSYSSYRLRGLFANLAARGYDTGYSVDCYCPDIS